MNDIDAVRKKFELIKKLPDTRMASYARVIVPALLDEVESLREDTTSLNTAVDKLTELSEEYIAERNALRNRIDTYVEQGIKHATENAGLRERLAKAEGVLKVMSDLSSRGAEVEWEGEL